MINKELEGSIQFESCHPDSGKPHRSKDYENVSLSKQTKPTKPTNSDLVSKPLSSTYKKGWQVAKTLWSPGGRLITGKVRQRVVAKLPKIYDNGGDITKQWHIYYYCIHPQTGRLRRVRHWDGLAEYKTVPERRKAAYGIVSRIKRKLKAGWNPFIEKDELLEKDIASPTGKKKRAVYQILTWAFNEVTTGCRKGTIKTYNGYLHNFRDFINKRDIDYLDISQITEDDIALFEKFILHDKKLSNKTRNEVFSFLSKLYKFLIKKRIVDLNPFSGFEKLKHHSKPGKPYQQNARILLKKYISELDPQLWLLIEFIFYTFMRPGELRQLQLKSINLDNGTITVPGIISKNGKEQDVVIPFQLYEQLVDMKISQYPKEYYLFSEQKEPGIKPVGINYFGKRYKAIRQRLGFNGEHKLYHWKHTGTIEATKTIKNIKDLQMQARHHSLDMFDRYLRAMNVADSEDLRYNFPTI